MVIYITMGTRKGYPNNMQRFEQSLIHISFLYHWPHRRGWSRPALTTTIQNLIIKFPFLLFTTFFVIWGAVGVFLLFEEIEDCRGSSLWIMSVITLVRSWLHFMHPTSVIIMREIEHYFCKSVDSDEWYQYFLILQDKKVE